MLIIAHHLVAICCDYGCPNNNDANEISDNVVKMKVVIIITIVAIIRITKNKLPVLYEQLQNTGAGYTFGGLT